MAMQPRGLPLSRGYREIDVSEQLPGRQQISDFKRQVRGERARREQCRRDAHCSGKGGSHQFKVGSSAISITPEQGGGKATGSQECPRNPGTANSLVRGSVTDITAWDTDDRQVEERFATEQQVLQLLASDNLATPARKAD